jgi:hypothetical protein
MKITELTVQEFEAIVQKAINKSMGKSNPVMEAIHDANERRKDAEYERNSKPL